MRVDERERERRDALTTLVTRQQESTSALASPSPVQGMPGSGHILGQTGDGPPPYDEAADDDE